MMIDAGLYQGQVNATLSKMEVAFNELVQENDAGRI